MSLPKLFFFHNPKAGGTSVLEWLASVYPDRERAPLIVNDVDGHRALGGRYENYRGFGFYAGHYGRDIFEDVTEGHEPITNFRDPVERLISLYNYYRIVVPSTDDFLSQPRFACVQAAKTQDLPTFLLNEDPAVTLYTRNSHVRQLTRSGFETEADLTVATRFLDAMPWYFVSEDAVLSVARAEEWLGVKLAPFPRSNTTSHYRERVSHIDEGVRSEVRARNDLDYALYEYARRKVAG